MAESITYIDASGAPQTTDTYIVVDDKTTTWGDGIYYVNSNVEIKGTVTVTGDATLILGDGATLTVKPATPTAAGGNGADGITTNKGKTLTITAQSLGDNMGTLKVSGANGTNAAGSSSSYGGGGGAGGIAISSTLTVNAGNLVLNGGTGGNGGASGSDANGGRGGAGGNGFKGVLTVNNGNITATGGNGGNGNNANVGGTVGGKGGNGGNGAAGIYSLSSLAFHNGNITATGGNGGTAGLGTCGKDGGSGGLGIVGISCFYTPELTGGTVIATGGNGGNGGDSIGGKGGDGGRGGTGFLSSYQFNWDGTSLTVTGGNGGNSGSGDTGDKGAGAAASGLSAKEYSIKSGTLTATGGKSGKDSKGVSGADASAFNTGSQNPIYVNGGLTLKAGSSATQTDEIKHTSDENLGGTDGKLVNKLYVSAEPTPIDTATITVEGEYTYNGEAQEAAITVKMGGTTLEEGTDYTVVYSNNVNAGTALITVTGTGAYTGEITQNFTINKASLTVTDTVIANKTYDRTTEAEVSATGSLQGTIYGSDNVTIDTATGTFADKNAGEDKDVTVSYTLTGTGAGNYQVKDYKTTASISKREVTVQGTLVDNKDYDGTKTATVIKGSLQNTIDGDSVELNSTGEFDNKDAGTGKDVSVINTLSGYDAGNYDLITTEETLQANIYPKNLTVSDSSVANKIYDGNTTAEVTAGTLQGVIDNDQVSINTATGTFADKNVGKDKAVKVSYTIKGDDAGNYTVADDSFSANIDKRKISLTSGDATQQYDGEPLTKKEITAVNVVSGEGFDYSDFASQTEVGSAWNTFEYKAQEGTDADNYNITVIPGSLIVTATDAEVKSDSTDLIVPDTQTQEVVAFNIVSTNGAAKVQNDSDVNVSVGKVVAKGTATVENNGEGTVSVLGVGGVENVDILNHNKGKIEVIDELVSSGDMNIKNDTEEGGVIVIGGTVNTVGGELKIVNTNGNTINGGGSAATEDEVAAKIKVTGDKDVTITNEGHLNMNLTAKGKVTITNGAPHTLIGDYTGKDVSVTNSADGVAKDVTLKATGDEQTSGTVTLTGVEGSKFEGDNKITALGTQSKIEFVGTNTFTGKLVTDSAEIGGSDAVIKLTDVDAEFKNAEIFNPKMEISGTSKVVSAIKNCNVTLKDGVILSSLVNDCATIEGDATLKDGAQLILDGDQTIASGKTVTVTGEKTTLTYAAGKTLTNDGTINISEKAKLIGAGTGTFNNAGILNVDVAGTVECSVSNTGTINLKGGSIGSSSALTNSGTLNWDLSEGNRSKIDWSKLTNNQGGKLAITVNADDTLGASYTIANNASSATGTQFTLTGIKSKETTITVGSEAVYNGIFYKLTVNSNNELVFTADCYVTNPNVEVTTKEEWFNANNPIILEGTVEDYIGCGIQSMVITGSGLTPATVDCTVTASGTDNLYNWSGTFNSAETVKEGTVLTITATDNSDPDALTGEAKYTLKADGTGPAINFTRTPEEGFDDNLQITVTASAEDLLSGLASLTYKIDGGTETAYTESLIIDKNCTITFTATDNVGNTTTQDLVIGDYPEPYDMTISITADSKYYDAERGVYTKVYDGTTLSTNGYNCEGLVEGDVMDVKLVDNSIVNAETVTTDSTITIYRDFGKGQKDITRFYNITKTEATLEITKREISVTVSGSSSKVYDGTTEFSNESGYSYTINESSLALVKGDVLLVTGLAANSADVGSGLAVSVSDFFVFSDVNGNGIYDEGDIDVTDNYDVTGTGTADITKRSVTLTSGSSSKNYDGLVLTNSDVNADSFADGEGATYSVSGSRTLVGTSKNTFTYQLNGNTKASNYSIVMVEGDLTVTKAAAPTITIDAQQLVYNGETTLSLTSGYTVDGLATGDKISSITVTLSSYNIGGYSTYDVTYSIVNANSDVVTDCYEDAQITKGTISVTQREITIAGGDSQKTYDGTALTCSDYTVTSGDLATGDSATIVCTADSTITHAGSTANKINTVTIKKGEVDVTGNYSIKTADGKLTVDKRAASVESASDSKVYDGTELTNEAVMQSGFLTGDGAIYTVTGTQTLAGESDNTFSYEFHSTIGSSEEDYEITKKEGTLSVTPIATPITITAASGEKVYDGTELTVSDFSYTAGILLEGDLLEVTVEGGRTAAGTAANKVTYYKVMRGTEDVTDCYTFTASVDGTLTVTQKDLHVTTGSATKRYDGTALTRDAVEFSGFIAGEGASIVATGTQTKIGTADNTYSMTAFAGTSLDNYNVIEDLGELAVTGSESASEYNYTAKSDVVQLDKDGNVFIYQDTNDGYVKTLVNNVSGWQAVETRRDLNGDSLADIQIIADDGIGSTWVAMLRNDYMEGGSVAVNYQYTGNFDNKLWGYIGSADLDGNGVAEVLMQQTEAGADGQFRHVVSWVTNEEGLWVDCKWIGGLTSEWKVIGTAAVTGDGSDKVILNRADGMIGYWSESGTNNIIEVWNAGGSTLLGSGEFDGDGAADLLWANIYGNFFTWENIGEQVLGKHIGDLSDLGGDWKFSAVGDYNGDGMDEILWSSSDDKTLAYSEANKENFKNLTVIA